MCELCHMNSNMNSVFSTALAAYIGLCGAIRVDNIHVYKKVFSRSISGEKYKRYHSLETTGN